MSVRVYELSKQVGMSNKEVIDGLTKLGLTVSSPSNTIPDIYADEFLSKYAPKAKEKPAAKKAEPKKEAPKQKGPPAGFVKSAADVQAAKDKAAAPKAPAIPPVKSAPAPVAAPKIAPMHKAAGAPKMPATHAHKPKAPSMPAVPKAAAQAPSKGGVVRCKPPIVLREFAPLIGRKPFQLISELMKMGIFASMNQSIEEDVARQLAENHGYKLEVQHRGEQAAPKAPKPKPEPVDESKFLEPRPPVVCVLGHVDHGKTTLLDTIRKTNVVSGEAGGITQHIGAYQVENKKHKITFIDTPGHAAFSKMRERGANLTDVAILVVAADDSFKPQTEEALKFAQKANVPVVVAINKMDAPGANIDKVKQGMQQRGITSEDWGGETLCAPVSALKGENIDELLEQVLLQAEMLELKANPKCPAEGVIVESQVEVGRGPTATVIVQKGTLKVGDTLVCGGNHCKVKAMLDDKGQRLKSAPPSTPVSVMGWSDAPEAGATFTTVKNERVAKQQAEENAEQVKKEQLAEANAKPTDIKKLFAAIQSNKNTVLKVIIKGDVHGSVEALKACLEGIKSDKVSLEVIHAEVGPVTKNDVITAGSAGATVVAFNTKQDQGVAAAAKHHDVRIIQHSIIYEIIDQVKEAMEDLLEPVIEEKSLGRAQVRQLFPLGKGTIAGCMVQDGKIVRDAFARVLRPKQKEPIFEGRVGTLKRFKDDTTEVRSGFECGICVNGFNDFEENDEIECFELVKVKQKL